ncbi:MAG: hypothetical protein ACLFV5_06555 [Anaerolineales bacterium]
MVRTQDAMDGQIPAEGRCVKVDDSRANPMTGPIRMRGCATGTDAGNSRTGYRGG